MGQKSTIEWTEATWNPIRGCSRVSEGCRNCYAEREANRHKGPGEAYDGLVQIANGHPQWTGKVRFVREHLLDPTKWTRSRRIFVNSMSDLFHEGLPDEPIDMIFDVMQDCPQHIFQVLTKRPARMLDFAKHRIELCEQLRESASADDPFCDDPFWWKSFRWPLPNVWLGVSCEDQRTADERIPLLLSTPSAVRWVSAEPLLGPIDLEKICFGREWKLKSGKTIPLPYCKTALQPHTTLTDEGDIDWPKLDWVVAGGESGPGARPMHPDWARSLRDQCQAAGVPFFFKQWGEWSPIPGHPFNTNHFCWLNRDGQCTRESKVMVHGEGWQCMAKLGKKAAGRSLDGREWNEYPELEAVTVHA